jgi:hypothetical protein
MANLRPEEICTMADPAPAKERRWPLWVSIVVLAATAAIHIFIGTPDILPPVIAAQLPPEPGAVMVALWHLTSVLLVLLPVALWWVAREATTASRPLLAFVWLICLAFVVIMLGLDLAGGALISPLVQWTLFAPAVLLLPLTKLRPAITS